MVYICGKMWTLLQRILSVTPHATEEESCDRSRRRIRPTDMADERDVGDVMCTNDIRINQWRKAEMPRGVCLRRA